MATAGSAAGSMAFTESRFVTESRIQRDYRPAPDRRLAEIVADVSGSIPSPSPGQARVLQRLQDLLQRLEHSRFHLAVLGQFKRGKSTLLNALLGVPLLPAAVVPLTAISTFLRAGSAPLLRTISSSGAVEDIVAQEWSDLVLPLARFVTEEGNPRNKLGLQRVELVIPNALLAKGIVLIDTPGVGSTFTHNTDHARATLPDCDAAIFVVSTDPPLTETEAVFLDEVIAHVAHLIIVLNKIDLANAEDLAVMMNFLRRSLAERVRGADGLKVFPISARDALQAKLAGDADALVRSGLPALECHLSDFLARSKHEVLVGAVARKIAAGLDEIILETEIKREALRMPLNELDARIETLRTANEQLEAERAVARDRLAGDRRRMRVQIETEATRLQARALEKLMGPIDRETGPIRDVVAARSKTMKLGPALFEEERERMSNATRDRIAAAAGAHRRRAIELIGLIQQTAADLMNVSVLSAEMPDDLDFRHEPYWIDIEQLDALKPFPSGMMDRLLPRRIRDVRIRKRLGREIDDLVRRNVENLRWALLQNVEDAFRKLDAEFDTAVAASIEATAGAIVRARQHRVVQGDGASAELMDTEATLTRLRGHREAVHQATCHENE